MRTLMKFHINAGPGNEAIKSGTLPKVLEETFSRIKPEAAYFCTEAGRRTGYVVFDLEDPAQIPIISEPLFEAVDAEIEYSPVMNLDDLQRGLGQVMQHR